MSNSCNLFKFTEINMPFLNSLHCFHRIDYNQFWPSHKFHPPLMRFCSDHVLNKISAKQFFKQNLNLLKPDLCWNCVKKNKHKKNPLLYKLFNKKKSKSNWMKNKFRTVVGIPKVFKTAPTFSKWLTYLIYPYWKNSGRQ